MVGCRGWRTNLRGARNWITFSASDITDDYAREQKRMRNDISAGSSRSSSLSPVSQKTARRIASDKGWHMFPGPWMRATK